MPPARPTRVLVPLDGSAAAEVALPYAERLAAAHGAEVLLVRAALDVSEGRAPSGAGPSEAVEAARSYLARHEASLRARGISARAIVPYGPAAEVIVDNARLQQVDAVVMSAHGKSDAATWGLGGVAEKVVRGVGVPVLLVQGAPPSEHPDGLALVPLDGSRLAECVLPWAEAVLTAFGYRALLLAVVKQATLARGQPDSQSMMAREAQAYLDDVSARLEPATQAHTEVVAGDPAGRILERSERPDVSVIVLCSHGRTGVGRWAQGSVTEKVLLHAAKPILLRPAPGATADGAMPAEAPACHNCGRQVDPETTPSFGQRCARCGYPLRSCANCEHFDGIVCRMGNPWSRPIDIANQCPDFSFRRRV